MIVDNFFTIVFLLTSITYSYFNYTKTGDNNTLVSGDIYMYLNEGQDQIKLTNIFQDVYILLDDGYLSSSYVDIIKGFRPVISLKLGIKFEQGGDGTEANPYVVKYE